MVANAESKVKSRRDNEGGQLPKTESERGVFGRTAAHGSDQQVGQQAAALAAKNSDAPQRSAQPVLDPEDSDGVERVLEFRKRVAQEFEQLTSRRESTITIQHSPRHATADTT